MTKLERRMIDVLQKLRQEVGVIGVKAEFEAEGTRVEELLRLLDVASKAGLKIALKIGGCEAVRDLIESQSYGCDYIIAPMVETEYALIKFIEASKKIYGVDRASVDLLFNIETKTSFENRDELIKAAVGDIDGVVFGRVDYVTSCGISRADVNSKKVLGHVKQVAELCSASCLDFVIGGGISTDSLDFLRDVSDSGLARFETRKIIFEANSLKSSVIEEGLLKAVEFELLWLKNKRQHYEIILNEDKARIEMLESRWGRF